MGEQILVAHDSIRAALQPGFATKTLRKVSDMDPAHLGQKYDKIAEWWLKEHENSQYGTKQLKKSLTFCSTTGTALDVGCGAGGRMVRILESSGFNLVGIDVSAQMIELARANHPGHNFYLEDICSWKTEQKFELILAWDSIFHLPLSRQKTVVAKLCNYLKAGGVLIYTFGDTIGEHHDEWHGDSFYYSSIGISENLRLLAENDVTCKHLELDQWPENHVYLIGVKNQ